MPPREQAPELRRSALIARQRRDHNAALAGFESLLQVRPGDPAVHVDCAAELRQLGRFDEAIAHCRTALDMRPGMISAMRGLGFLARALGNHEEALTHFRASAAKSPGNAVMIQDCGLELLCLGRTGEAEALFAQALALQPGLETSLKKALAAIERREQTSAAARPPSPAAPVEDEAAQAAAAIAGLRGTGRQAEACRLSSEWIVKFPDHAGILTEYGRAATACGDLASAVQSLERAIALDAASIDARLALARACHLGAQFARAGALYDEVLALQPERVAARAGKELLALASGDRACMRERLGPLLDDRGLDVEYRIWLAEELRRSGELDEARRAACGDDTLAEDPRLVRERAFIERAAGRPAEAAACFERLIALDGADNEARIEAAVDRLAAGDVEIAAHHVDGVLDAEAGHMRGLELKATLHEVAGQAPDAANVLRRILSLEPKRLPALYALARLSVAMGDVAGGVTLLDEARRIDPEGPEPLVHAAATDARLGFLSRAMEQIEQAAVRFPDDASVRYQRARIGLQLGRLDAVTEQLRSWPCTTLAERGQLAEISVDVALEQGDVLGAEQILAAAASGHVTDDGVLERAFRVALVKGDVTTAGTTLEALASHRSGRPPLRDRPVTLSESLDGRVLEELRLNAGAAGALASAWQADPASRLDALADVVAAFPQQTLAPIAVLAEARRSNGFAEAAGSPPRLASIPRRIVQYFHEDEIPDDVASLMASWREHNPGYEISVFSEDSARAYMLENYGSAGERAFGAAQDPSMKADLIRLAVINRDGGFAADADDRCVGPLGALENAPGMVCYQERIGGIGSSFYGAVAGNMVVERALQAALEAFSRGDAGIRWLVSGSGLMSRAVAAHMAAGGVWRGTGGVRVLTRAELAAMVSVGCIASYQQAPAQASLHRLKTERPQPRLALAEAC